jgi:hypothetical protein
VVFSGSSEMTRGSVLGEFVSGFLSMGTTIFPSRIIQEPTTIPHLGFF